MIGFTETAKVIASPRRFLRRQFNKLSKLSAYVQYIHIFTHTHARTHTYIYTHTHTNTHMYTNEYTSVRIVALRDPEHHRFVELRWPSPEALAFAVESYCNSIQNNHNRRLYTQTTKHHESYRNNVHRIATYVDTFCSRRFATNIAQR